MVMQALGDRATVDIHQFGGFKENDFTTGVLPGAAVAVSVWVFFPSQLVLGGQMIKEGKADVVSGAVVAAVEIA